MNSVYEMVRKMTCTGCGACISFCPHGLISFKEGELGFPIPSVDRIECRDCGTCLRNCPFSDLYGEEEE